LLAEQPEQVGVQPVPDARLFPRPEPAVGGPPGAPEFPGTSSHRLPVARTNQVNHITTRWAARERPPFGPTGCWGGIWWATRSSNSSACLRRPRRESPLADGVRDGGANLM